MVAPTSGKGVVLGIDEFLYNLDLVSLKQTIYAFKLRLRSATKIGLDVDHLPHCLCLLQSPRVPSSKDDRVFQAPDKFQSKGKEPEAVDTCGGCQHHKMHPLPHESLVPFIRNAHDSFSLNPPNPSALHPASSQKKHSLTKAFHCYSMAVLKFTTGLTALALLTSARAQASSEDLILCDCGIGDNEEHQEWSTSRQINWYEDIEWPDTASEYPAAPDKVVEVPFNDGIYPWTPDGVTATLDGGDVWTIYIEDGTPDGFNAGTAVTTKDRGQTLNCWAYRGRPVSGAINTTVTEDAICYTAFVCNHDDQPPPRPEDMFNPTSSPVGSELPPATSVFSTSPTSHPTTTDGDPGEPEPTEEPSPQEGALTLYAAVNPRFVNWNNNWESFINNFVWDQTTGDCVGNPVYSDGYNITFQCGGIQLDENTHMTLLMIKALRDVGLTSLWFNQKPPIPPGTGQGNATSWVVLPEAFTLSATDASTSNVIGYISYNTKYDGFTAGPCATCETERFNEAFFDPIIAAVQGSYPSYWSYNIQAQCVPWINCK